jgi:excinuclease ABC subunit C
VTPELKATLANLPDRPGVYLMKDARGEVLYVGKAQSLRSRVRSYWQKQAPGGRGPGEVHRIRQAIDRVADLEVTETDSVSEALLLEANLIKRFKPRFNVRLKDDKSYPYIKITLADDFPRIERTRKLPNDGSRYFGPYASASSVDEAMNLVRRLFPFRTCTIDIHEGRRALQRPCLLYHIKRCQGPCVEAISKAAYRRDIAQVELFLEGNADVLVDGLRHEMHVASEEQQYEKAGVVRDKIRAIERTMESQKMAAFARTELDLVAMARKDDQAAVQLFVVRNGKMLGRDVFFLEAPRDVPDDEVLGSFLEQYYARATSVPREVLVPRSVADVAELEAFLSARRGSLVHLRTPQRGEKRELMDLAARNASETLAREAARWLADEGRTLGALRDLAVALELPGPPMRIECYDISNFQGAQSVGSMVVFEEGRPRTGEYRRFQIRTVQGANDFASHQEVLRRRFRGTKAGEEGTEEERRWAMPDLVVIDGGRGQVSAAKEVLDELGLGDLPLVGLAKEREELIRFDRPEPVLLPVTSPALYLVQRLRDEAHRFAITYHRNLRNKKAVKSAFDDLPGVGPKRKRELLKVFGSAKRVREAPVEQIAAVPGISRALAERIKAHLEA